jgi:hypothetical protein
VHAAAGSIILPTFGAGSRHRRDRCGRRATEYFSCAKPWCACRSASSGRFEVEVSSDGTIKSFGPGNILFAEDTTGKGHKTRAVGGDCVWLFIELDDPAASNGVRNQ